VIPPSNGHHVGPHTESERGETAYELKFLLASEPAADIETWARAHLTNDPFGDPKLEGAYRTSTLYLDTIGLDVYHRSPWYRRRKLRIRRYNADPDVYFEQKSRSADRVRKQRSRVPLPEIAMLGEQRALATWPGAWFHGRVLVKSLLPSALVTYRRNAYVGHCAEGPLRLTIDREIVGSLAHAWQWPDVVHNQRLLTAQVIVELKFLGALPQPFKDMVRDFRLSPAVVSKYRLSRDAWADPAFAAGASLTRRETARA
jgi:hypothetical protein